LEPQHGFEKKTKAKRETMMKKEAIPKKEAIFLLDSIEPKQVSMLEGELEDFLVGAEFIGRFALRILATDLDGKSKQKTMMIATRSDLSSDELDLLRQIKEKIEARLKAEIMKALADQP
jgi:hypothetical protein